MTVIKQLWRNNPFFYRLFAGFIITGAFLLLVFEQGDEILYINQRRSAFGDVFFKFATQLGEAVVYFPVLFLLLFVKYRHAVTLPLLGLTVTIVSYVSKALFSHDRPLAFFRKSGLLDQLNPIDGVAMHGGATSFPSGHTMSAFALFAFLAFCLPNKRSVGVLLFTTALLVGLSRIYLLQHFLKDVYLGALMGVAIAVFWYLSADRYFTSPRLNGSLSLKKQV